ncbi:MAG: hypothetical protein WCA98_07575 [Candidatus Acidiferrales bacterium]
MNRKPLLLMAAVFIAGVLLTACGSSSKQPIAVTISTAPPNALEVSYTGTVGASVTGDAANAGVDWTVTCGSADCGAFSPSTHTASGDTLTYTAPATVPTGGTVTITAASTTDATKTAGVTITINPIASASTLTGQYAFLVTGLDLNGEYLVAGSFTADGAGNISATAGEEDYCDIVTECELVTITGGTYTLGPDGRGSIAFTVSDATLGVAGLETFSVAVSSSAHGQIVSFDTSATSSGTLDLQDATLFAATTSVAGGYSFVTSGVDYGAGVVASFGGVATADGNGNLVSGILDLNDGGVFNTFNFNSTNSTYIASDTNGRGTVTVDGLSFAYYIVGGECLRLIETDFASTDLMQAGSAYGQGAVVASPAALTGSFVFSDAGNGTVGPYGAVGQITTDGAGNVTAGVADVDEDGSVSTAGALTGSTYVMPNTGGGRGYISLPNTPTTSQDLSILMVYLVDPNLDILDPNNNTGGGGALILDAGTSTFGSGFLVPQAAGAVFQGNYAINAQFFPFTTSEGDFVGQFFTDGATITGNVDLNIPILVDLLPAQAFTGTITADAVNLGRYTDSVVLCTSGLTESLVYYQASGAQLVFISETNEATGVLVHQ